MENKSVHLAYFGLLALLAMTVSMSYLELGFGNELLAYGFATLKALIILIVFMSLTKEHIISKVYFYMALFGILLIVVFVMDDLVFRN
ncbi:cytochrome C oxidase subunit IV family protein [Peredibacter starrii]|uniref:Cytochrome c oxidase subunit 4 n=1 Tax=Peredibacter starrii TaxID=28202 RepID=A0AAX4HSR4_9BACT|nr:hypothetical protein [Peredibacter starrii]WPU66061.1 hypothetical protein SOO65_04815 [Peredibacter starrii]